MRKVNGKKLKGRVKCFLKKICNIGLRLTFFFFFIQGWSHNLKIEGLCLFIFVDGKVKQID